MKTSWLELALAALVWAGGTLAGSACAAADDQNADAPPIDFAPDELFGLTRIHPFHLEMSAAEWDKMQAVVGRGPMGGPGRGPRPDEPKETPPGENPPVERHKSSGFGTEFPWALGKLTAGGKTFENVGVRYKGNASYGSTAGALKRNLKIELDHYGADGRLQGAKTLNLNAGGSDPTRLREAMAFEVFRSAGVPAPRTAFVELTLTVPGKYDRELVGLYTLIEQVDNVFLRDRFHSGHGLLMKPERLRDFGYLGDDWDKYDGRYHPRHSPTKKQARRVIDFVRLVDQGGDEKFDSEIESYLDVDEFLRYLAAGAWLANMDSLLAVGHNYYIYLNPEANKLAFIPWDLDLSFAGFPMAGSPDELMNLSLKHPHAGANKLIDRLLALPRFSDRYQAILEGLATTAFAKDRLLGQLAALEKATGEARTREAAAVEARSEKRRGGPPGGGRFGRSVALAAFVEQRTLRVNDQLAGKDPGYTPRGGFGPGGPGRFGPGNFMAGPLLAALDTNHDGKLTPDEVAAGAEKFFADRDSSQDGKLDQAALAASLSRVVPPPPRFGPPPPDVAGPPPPRGPEAPEAPAERSPDVAGPDATAPPGPPRFGGPPRFAPAALLAERLMDRADANRDGQITLEEAGAAAASLFADADTDKKGDLDERKLAAQINALFPPRPGFGPPGFGPPGSAHRALDSGFGRRNRGPQPPRSEEANP